MRLDRIVLRLKREANWRPPSVSALSRRRRSPYRVLVATLISLRTKDEVTSAAARRLLRQAPDPQTLSKLRPARIERLIYPAGFYRTKARRLVEIAKILLERHGGDVPHEMDALLALPGVGLKTASLVLVEGFNIPAICVDTHVHRISNRLGVVAAATPDKSEAALREVLPRRHWAAYNELLVGFGQTICRPVSPYCSRCPIARLCPRVNVKRHR
jgi:endonuclease-3